MGHYDSCYEADEERARDEQKKRVEKFVPLRARDEYIAMEIALGQHDARTILDFVEAMKEPT